MLTKHCAQISKYIIFNTMVIKNKKKYVKLSAKHFLCLTVKQGCSILLNNTGVVV